MATRLARGVLLGGCIVVVTAALEVSNLITIWKDRRLSH